MHRQARQTRIGEQDLGESVAFQAPEELGSHPVSDGKEKHEEKDRLDVRRDDDVQLPNEDSGEEDAGDRPEAEFPDL